MFTVYHISAFELHDAAQSNVTSDNADNGNDC